VRAQAIFQEDKMIDKISAVLVVVFATIYTRCKVIRMTILDFFVFKYLAFLNMKMSWHANQLARAVIREQAVINWFQQWLNNDASSFLRTFRELEGDASEATASADYPGPTQPDIPMGHFVVTLFDETTLQDQSDAEICTRFNHPLP